MDSDSEDDWYDVRGGAGEYQGTPVEAPVELPGGEARQDRDEVTVDEAVEVPGEDVGQDRDDEVPVAAAGELPGGDVGQDRDETEEDGAGADRGQVEEDSVGKGKCRSNFKTMKSIQE